LAVELNILADFQLCIGDYILPRTKILVQSRAKLKLNKPYKKGRTIIMTQVSDNIMY